MRPASDVPRLSRRPPRGAAAVVAVALVAGTWGVVTSPVFDLQRVRVVGNDRLSPEEVARLAGVRAGANVLALSPRRVERALALSPWIEWASVERSLPSTVVVWVRERRAVAWVRDRRGVATLSADGVVLERRHRAPRSLVSLGRRGSDLRPGDRIPGLGAPLAVAASLPAELREAVRSIRVARGEVVLRLEGGGRVRYGDPADLQAKNAALVSILAWAGERGARVADVDLRLPRSPSVREAG